jgi:hypothetical protein
MPASKIVRFQSGTSMLAVNPFEAIFSRIHCSSTTKGLPRQSPAQSDSRSSSSLRAVSRMMGVAFAGLAQHFRIRWLAFATPLQKSN